MEVIPVGIYPEGEEGSKHEGVERRAIEFSVTS
jgi:hypothetical protein